MWLSAPAAHAQDLEPRVYLASPVGSNVVVVAVARSTGDVICDAGCFPDGFDRPTGVFKSRSG